MSIIILQLIIGNVVCFRNILPPMNFCKESRCTSRDNTTTGILLQSSCNGTMFSVGFTHIGNAMPALFTYDPIDLVTKKMNFLLISFQHENLLQILGSAKKSAYMLHSRANMSIPISQFIMGNVACIGIIIPPMNFCKQSRNQSRDNTIAGILLQSPYEGNNYFHLFLY